MADFWLTLADIIIFFFSDDFFLSRKVRDGTEGARRLSDVDLRDKAHLTYVKRHQLHKINMSRT
jgi:hypothetical protein